MLLNKNTLGLQQRVLIETEENTLRAYTSQLRRVRHTPAIFTLLFECVSCPSAFPPQVLLVLMAWLGTAGPAREDLRGHQERPVTPGRQDPQVSQGTVRQPCAWLHQRTLPQGYRRRERLKDPVFKSAQFPSAALKTRNRKEEGAHSS